MTGGRAGAGVALLLLPLLAGCGAVDDALGLGADAEPVALPRSLPAGDAVEAVVDDPWHVGRSVVSGGVERCGSSGPGFAARTGSEAPPYDPDATVLAPGWASVSLSVPAPAPDGAPAPATVTLVPDDHGPPSSFDGEAVLSRDGAVFTGAAVSTFVVSITCR